MNEPTTTANGKAIEEQWPTARVVAKKLGCTAHQVYKLERGGLLHGRDVRVNGVKLRRFDPADVRTLADADALEQILDVELTEPDDDEAGDNAPPPNAMRLAANVVTESRQLALDARKGQHEAYELIAKPAREFTETIMKALDQREKRIAELEAKLSQFYDEQREARLEDRELAMMQSRLDRDDLRKDQMFKTFFDHLPLVLDQLKTSLSGGGGPFAEWLKGVPPEKQKKLILAIEAVTADDDEQPSASSAEASANVT